MPKPLLTAALSSLLLTYGAVAQQKPTAAAKNAKATETTPARNGQAGNPVFPGWYADPEGIIFGNRYWIYPTYSAPFDEQVFMDAFSSPDLVHWTRHPRILDTTRIKWARRAMWAPAVVEKGGKYYLFFGANDVHEGEVGGIGVAVADRPEGPFTDYLGKPLIGQIHNGAQPIDQFVFRDADGQYYLVYGGWSHCNIARLKDDFTGFEPFPDGQTFREITPQGYVEGPFMFIRRANITSCGRRAAGAALTIRWPTRWPIRPSDRFGAWARSSSRTQRGYRRRAPLRDPGAGQGPLVRGVPPPAAGRNRPQPPCTCIDRLYFDGQGGIKPVRITREGVGRQPLEGERRGFPNKNRAPD
jgi:hypothetical protein